MSTRSRAVATAMLTFIPMIFLAASVSADELAPDGRSWSEYCQDHCDVGCREHASELRCEDSGPSNDQCTTGSTSARIACCAAKLVGVEGCDGNHPVGMAPPTGEDTHSPTGSPAAAPRSRIPGSACREADVVTQELNGHEQFFNSSCVPPQEGRTAAFFDTIRLPAAGETSEEALARLDFTSAPLSDLRPLLRLYERAPTSQKAAKLENLLTATSTRLLLERKSSLFTRDFTMAQPGDSTLQAQLLALRARLDLYQGVLRRTPASERPEWAASLAPQLATLRSRVLRVERTMNALAARNRNFWRVDRLAVADALGKVLNGCPEWTQECPPADQAGSLEDILAKMGTEMIPESSEGSEGLQSFVRNTNAIRESALNARAILRGESEGNGFRPSLDELNRLSDCRWSAIRMEAVRPLANRKATSCANYCRRTGAQYLVEEGHHSCVQHPPVISDSETNDSPDGSTGGASNGDHTEAPAAR